MCLILFNGVAVGNQFQASPIADVLLTSPQIQTRIMKPKIDRKRYPVSASDYILLEEVGHGVSATVYKAKCVPFDEDVAIKVMNLEKCNYNLDDVRREAQTMRLINHPNVLRAHCSFVVERSLWVIMPYMGGGSWLHIMKSSYPDGLEEPVIATILRDCLKGLEYLHRHGHIHRDVKAGNILADATGAIKLGDFGVSACLFDSGTWQRSRITFVGTPCWMAPEVMEQLHGYDFKADIWSFGITALELAHGHAPFSKYPPMKVLLMTLQNAPPGLDYERDKRFSKSFKDMVAACLVKDPAKRPTAEKLLRHSFFKRARSNEYIARSILDGLPDLAQMLKDIELKDAVKLAQKKMPSDEVEEISQSEYKRGVSSWNFDLEDLKAQAALVPDDDEANVAREEIERSEARCSSADNDIVGEISCCEGQAGLSETCKKIDMCPFETDAGHETEVNSFHGHSDSVQSETTAPLTALHCAEFSKQATRGIGDILCTRPQHWEHTFNGAKEVLENGIYVQKKGRFSVTCLDIDLVEAYTRAFSELSHSLHSPISAAAVLPQLENILQQSVHQQELISDLINRTCKACHDIRPASKLFSQSSCIAIGDSLVEAFSEREQKLLQQVADLQSRVTDLVDELYAFKLQNVSLESQLSAISNEGQEDKK